MTVVSYNPFASDEANAAYLEEEARLLGRDDPKSHGYADRLLDAADQQRKADKEVKGA